MKEQATPVLDAERDFLTSFDLHLFREGTHLRLYEKLGAQRMKQGDQEGTHFAVWAPNAQRVFVMGDFNGWDKSANPLSQCGDSGIWAGFIPDVRQGAAYKYHILSWHHAYQVDKSDPVGFRQEGWPGNASLVWDLGYDWHDQDWILNRANRSRLEAPISIYEVHLESWMRVPEQGNRWLTYLEIAPKLAGYAQRLGFTHVQLMPVMEHPTHAWSDYDILGFFAPCSRLGSPQDLMHLIDVLHQYDIGVILDWVPSHFPAHQSGLMYFDGAHLYEQGPSRLIPPSDGESYCFDYSRPEVRSFLLSNASFWLDKFHVDGLRINSVSSMLFVDWGRKPGEWFPNPYGGREYLEGIDFLKQLNAEVYRNFPHVQMIAHERTGWPMLSRPTYSGGIGFGLKCATEFSSKTLGYFSHDPFFRKFHHGDITSQAGCAFEENLLLTLPHEELCQQKKSVLARMPGDEWQKFANLRALLGYMYFHPGKKMLFMGTEFGQWNSWNHDGSLDWHLCAYPHHSKIQLWVGDLNRVYRTEPALHLGDTEPAGFEWVEPNDAEQSTLTWLRRDPQRREVLLIACNFTPVVRKNFRVGVRRAGDWRELLNSDAPMYGGSGQGNLGSVATSPFSTHGFPQTLTLTLPPLAIVVFKHGGT